MKTKFLAIFILMSIIFVPTVQAQQQKPCIYNGKSYPSGTSLGPYVCRDGTWK